MRTFRQGKSGAFDMAESWAKSQSDETNSGNRSALGEIAKRFCLTSYI